MTIYIKRNLHSRWGVNGECFINDTKVCDTVEHPTAHRPAGVYQLPGLVLQAAEMHQRLRQRVKKAIKRGENVELIIQ